MNENEQTHTKIKLKYDMSKPTKTTLTVKGTHCNSCKALIEDVCTEISGITTCNVDFKTGITEIEHEENVDWQKFKKEVEALGEYKVEINQ